MDDFIASILTLVLVSPAIVVLLVLIARGIRDACALSTCTKSNETIGCNLRFRGKLCGELS